MKKIIILLFLSFCFSIFGISQQEDPVLFEVDGKPVHVSEFLYIYQKNNGDKADFSEKNLKEYLDLYIKFKLKVTKARQMKLDTIPELKAELAGYRKQLSKSYLVDKEVNEKLIKEVFERRQRDLDVSHILVVVHDETDVEKLTLAKAKIFYVHNKLNKGASFEEMAIEHSEDKSSAELGGTLGYVTSMLPNGFYEFENALYDLKVGEYSKPVQTDYGFHIVKLNAERPARGEIEASHILIRNKTRDGKQIASKEKIDSLYQKIMGGEDFEELARTYSMDSKTSVKGGYLGIFGINQYESGFEDQVFSLSKDGEVSAPFQTSIGWHIAKRISKPDIDDYKRSKRSIGSEITKDGRYEIAKKVLVEKIKTDAGFSQDTSQLGHFTRLLSPSFFTLYWDIPEKLDQELFNLGQVSYSLEDFAKYCKKKQRDRTKYSKNSSIRPVVDNLYESFLTESCMDYEESKLEESYPDFRSLMREYDEGILLFEATKREVWDKASQDTSGLRNFYNMQKGQYLWKTRADLYTYSIHLDDKDLAEKVYDFSQKKDHDKVIEKFNKENQLVTFSRNKFERGHGELNGLKWKKGTRSPLQRNKDTGVYTFKKIAEILKPSPKSLSEARGYVIADYQEYLEKNWIAKLEKEFPVDINKEVFKSLVKK